MHSNEFPPWVVGNDSNLVIVRQEVDHVLNHFRQFNISDLEVLYLFSNEIQKLVTFTYSEGLGLQFRRIQPPFLCFKRAAGNRLESHSISVAAHLDRINEQLLSYGVLGENATIDSAREWTAKGRPALMIFLSTTGDLVLGNPDALVEHGNIAAYMIRISTSYHSIQK